MDRLTIIPIDSAVYIDDQVWIELDLSFIPNDVHALQWLNEAGWIEYNTGEPNALITELPEWANEAVELAESQTETEPEPATIDDIPLYVL